MIDLIDYYTKYKERSNGIFYGFYNELNSFTPEQFDKYMDCIYQTCEDKNTALNCMHGLYIGKI